ncbi:MAG: 16S rRNA (guanine(527)-N(7))-methyltransferase [Gammaproteobacteria bacterium RIFCSPHIGHO2_02_FULL_42_13]|nr:MAG: 16S rRNA (guanine(527)-N(7))-methyltransferase [Gammaproteobacteria bacterium RIFCSPHIGHO2_02_FULL_42_13]OGT68384.1 MAG: 16S rRNA (guanine(527)-N(7))-methyltransferase [Gammaproteobacteria bacterium RIFCSPLOWO2_02_FULL_42_9]
MLIDDFRSTLQKYLSQTVTAAQQEKLAQFLVLLSKWNKIYNLTAITDSREMVVKHILDSLSVAPYLHGERIVDVGTGAGLPGIPLAIILPDRQFTLLDSNGKKTRFLKQTLLELCMENIEIVHERAENYHPEYCFDTVVTRAFASIPDMLSATQHLCCENGLFLAMKGADPSDDLKTINKEFVVNKVIPLKVTGLNAERHVVAIKRM